jgi:hypothetical protein
MPPNVAQKELTDIRNAHAEKFKHQGEVKAQDKAFAAADIIAEAIGIPTHKSELYQASQGMQILGKGFDAKIKRADVAVKANPWFVANGHDDTGSPVTQAYLHSRAWKSVAGTGVSLAGSLLSAKTAGVNVGSAVRHGSAFLSTDGHLLGIAAIAHASKKTTTIARWCEVILKAKAAKASLRGMQTAGAVTPIPLVGPLINIAAAAGKLGIKIYLPEMCYLAAIEIHWRAFQEQQISSILGPRVPVPTIPNFSRPTRQWVHGASAPAPGHKRPASIKVGPASRIFAEIFTRRGVTAVFGSYDVAALIKEPAGWMALGDKLSRE